MMRGCPQSARCAQLGVCQAKCPPGQMEAIRRHFAHAVLPSLARHCLELVTVQRATLTAGPRGSMGEEA